MNLLLSNDDGYSAEGIKKLAEKLSLQHNVYVIAPASNRSAVSHHISMFKNLEIIHKQERVWACSGFPSDCVAVGLIGNLLDVKFDAVISGINMGGNMGTDIIYSGTCGAARQAVVCGIPAIAVSVEPDDWDIVEKEGFKFDAMCDFIDKNLEALVSMSKTESPRMFVNVNGLSIDKYKGCKFTTDLCIKDYRDRINVTPEDKDFKGRETFKTEFVFGNGGVGYNPENCDYYAVKEGFVSVSLVYADPLCLSSIDYKQLSV